MSLAAVVATTERLELRRFSPDDAGGLFALNAEPEALRYTGDVPFASVLEARRFLDGYDHYRRHGFGRWSVYRRDDQRYLGFCGLRRDPERGRVDLGFRIAPREWGRGFATEASMAALRLGFFDHGLDSVIARSMPDNAAAHRVLSKLGFLASGTERDDDGEWLLFELGRAEFERRAARS